MQHIPHEYSVAHHLPLCGFIIFFTVCKSLLFSCEGSGNYHTPSVFYATYVHSTSITS